jgi:hypothetical protein
MKHSSLIRQFIKPQQVLKVLLKQIPILHEKAQILITPPKDNRSDVLELVFTESKVLEHLQVAIGQPASLLEHAVGGLLEGECEGLEVGDVLDDLERLPGLGLHELGAQLDQEPLFLVERHPDPDVIDRPPVVAQILDQDAQQLVVLAPLLGQLHGQVRVFQLPADPDRSLHIEQVGLEVDLFQELAQLLDLALLHEAVQQQRRVLFLGLFTAVQSLEVAYQVFDLWDV